MILHHSYIQKIYILILYSYGVLKCKLQLINLKSIFKSINFLTYKLLYYFLFHCHVIACVKFVFSLTFSLYISSFFLLCFGMCGQLNTGEGFSGILMHLKGRKGHSQANSGVQILDSKRSGSKEAMSCWKNHT